MTPQKTNTIELTEPLIHKVLDYLRINCKSKTNPVCNIGGDPLLKMQRELFNNGVLKRNSKGHIIWNSKESNDAIMRKYLKDYLWNYPDIDICRYKNKEKLSFKYEEFFSFLYYRVIKFKSITALLREWHLDTHISKILIDKKICFKKDGWYIVNREIPYITFTECKDILQQTRILKNNYNKQ
jgi:hypothetical protein